MRRRLLDLLTWLSLLLSVGVAALWAVSYRWSPLVTSRAIESGGPGGDDLWLRYRATQAWRGVLVLSDRRDHYGTRGGMVLAIAVTPGRTLNWQPVERWPPHLWDRWRSRPPRFGFGLHRQTGNRGWFEWRLAVPLWAVTVAALLLPTARLTPRFLRPRRAGAALCPSCGYDLRATPGRCPECGTHTGNQPVG